jgi:hypothetical protein
MAEFIKHDGQQISLRTLKQRVRFSLAVSVNLIKKRNDINAR